MRSLVSGWSPAPHGFSNANTHFHSRFTSITVQPRVLGIVERLVETAPRAIPVVRQLPLRVGVVDAQWSAHAATIGGAQPPALFGEFRGAPGELRGLTGDWAGEAVLG